MAPVFLLSALRPVAPYALGAIVVLIGGAALGIIPLGQIVDSSISAVVGFASGVIDSIYNGIANAIKEQTSGGLL
jgi:hypothetical protein